MNFEKRYAKLNKAQKQAVDTIDGPVMVIAGPGTGKTELISVRTANILQKTDTLPENILCLTFTESGATAMRERLTDIIGKDAYKVAIHTFHSFGTEVINQNGQFFYQGAHFLPADELSSYEIIQEIFKNLKYNNPLASKLNDEYTYLSDSLKIISELKKSGLTSDELLAILDENNAVIEKTEQLLAPVFSNRINKDTALQLEKHITTIRNSNGGIILSTVVPLSQVLADSLESTVTKSESQNSTKPITAWKNQWFKKDNDDKYVLKSRERQEKLRAVSFIYEQYLTKMQQSSLYDFDDMILRVVHAMEVFNDLRFNLQEKYQYIMVDEFQDTNMAQMRILNNLTNNVVHGDTPNILVVGDDDQAIYSFQGADVSNIINFRINYPKAKLITLIENYRSTTNILDGSRNIILQGNERLENIYPDINKLLISQIKDLKNKTFLYEAETINDERRFIVNDIKSRISAGEKPNNIAVLTRKHNEINAILPYLTNAGIAVNYERRDNVLDIAPIKLIEQLAWLLINISIGNHDDINSRLPEILAHKAWEIEELELWQLSFEAYEKQKQWLDIMPKKAKFAPLYNWLIETASIVNDTPLEQMLDIIIGKPNSIDNDKQPSFISPFYEYYFSNDKLIINTDEYLLYLEALRTIRSKLREYHPDTKPTLFSFVEFITLNRKIGSTISVIRRSKQSENAINIMTAHKSKGLEFNTVYVFNAVDNIWGRQARSRNRLINYPENLPLAPAGETEDERLRLFYVAITRAKQNLHISYSLTNDNGKATIRAEFLVNSKWQSQQIPVTQNKNFQIEESELDWYQTLIEPTLTMQEYLIPKLENYKLSVTHLHNFLDVTRGGPANFLLQNLLHFPTAKSPNAAFGTAIHDTIQNAHMHFSSTGKKLAIEDIISNFEKILKIQHMMDADYKDYLQKGIDALQVFFEKNYSTFTTTQQTELNFASQHSTVGEAHLTGKLDLIEIDKLSKTISVTDYKTGKPSMSWKGKSEYEKIKLYKYKQQLLFYKLLIINSRDYNNYSVQSGKIQFVEPSISGDIKSLDIEYNSDELEYTSKLINAVWSHIIKLDLPDITKYESSYRGILAFEHDLIDNVI